MLILSANVFETIKGGKSSFTIHIGEKVEFQSSKLIKALKDVYS